MTSRTVRTVTVTQRSPVLGEEKKKGKEKKLPLHSDMIVTTLTKQPNLSPTIKTVSHDSRDKSREHNLYIYICNKSLCNILLHTDYKKLGFAIMKEQVESAGTNTGTCHGQSWHLFNFQEKLLQNEEKTASLKQGSTYKTTQQRL